MCRINSKEEREQKELRKLELNEERVHTWRAMATLILQPKAVETALGDKPKVRKSLENELVRLVLGLSSATATQYLTADRLIPFV